MEKVHKTVIPTNAVVHVVRQVVNKKETRAQIAKETELLQNAGNAMQVQQHQLRSAEEELQQIREKSALYSAMEDENVEKTENLLADVDLLLRDADVDTDSAVTEDEIMQGLALAGIAENEELPAPISILQTQTVQCDADDWHAYMAKIESYASGNQIELLPDPYVALLSPSQQREFAAQVREDYYARKPDCDRYDYMVAAGCGVLSGLIDSFFVGMPKESMLGGWTHSQADKFIINVANKTGWDPDEGNENKIGCAIAHLEKYKVNYDASSAGNLGDAAKQIFDMSFSNHHIKSLAHAPDFVGLIFSVIDQFTATAHFMDNGRLIAFDTKEQELHGDTFVAKLFCGICNWFWHCISDLAGSKARTEKPNSVGSGLPAPFFELFQLCKFGKIPMGNGEFVSFADLAVKMFEQGYDLRFSAAMGIPVMLNEMLIRLLFAIKRHFYNKRDWKDCIPLDWKLTGNQPELRRMLFVGHGVLCAIDVTDAGIRSGGNILRFALHLNYVAWVRLGLSGLAGLRAKCREEQLDMKKIEMETENEWKRLYADTVAH